MGGHFTRDKVLTRNMLSDRAVKLICQAYLADYCCFNFPWPPPCQALVDQQQQQQKGAGSNALPPRDVGTGITLHLSCGGPSRPAASSDLSGNGGDSNGALLDEDLAAAPLWRGDSALDRPRHPPHLYAAERNALMLQAFYVNDAKEKLASLR
jgi:hypothetical protein